MIDEYAIFGIFLLERSVITKQKLTVYYYTASLRFWMGMEM